MNLTPAEKKAVNHLAERLRREFGATGVILYGSAVRSEMDEESDIDLLAILPNNDWRTQQKVCDACFEEDMGLGRIISCMVCTHDEIENSPLKASPWLSNVFDEGVEL